MLTTRSGVRVLTPPDLDDFLDLANQDPVVNVFPIHRARASNLDAHWMGGEMWGRYDGDRLLAACHVAANLVPVQASVEDAQVFAERAVAEGRTASTIVGPQDAVAAVWEVVRDDWGPPREERWDQRHMAVDRSPDVAPDRHVRFADADDLDTLYPACVEMYTEEVGVSPEAGGRKGSYLYRSRVSQLIKRGWSFVRYDGEELVFKAEVAWATSDCAQIQGVWVAPHRRGEGLAGPGMSAVVELVREHVAPTVSLYVNEWNHPARRTYERVGFVETGRFASIMF